MSDMGPIETWMRNHVITNYGRVDVVGEEIDVFYAFAREQDAIRADLLAALESLLAIDDGRFFAHESWDDARAAIARAKGDK